MADHPIIFSAPMVEALLAGRKTQTRRLATSPLRRAQPGDRLWVREAWKAIPASAYPGEKSTPNPSAPDEVAVYRVHWAYSSGGVPWRPGIHMPRWASRLTLVVTEVRKQRLHDITEDEARDEGCWTERAILEAAMRESVPELAVHPSMVFRRLWDSLHDDFGWNTNPDVVALTFTVEQRNIDA